MTAVSKCSLDAQLGNKQPRFGGVLLMNKVTFRCNRSGNTVSFVNDGDIEGLRKHEGYTEVKDAETTKTVEVESPEAPGKEVLKLKRSRQPKPEIPSFLEM